MAYEDIKFWWRCEGLSLDANLDYSASDTTGIAQGSAEIKAIAKWVGTNGLHCPAGGDYVMFETNPHLILDFANSADEVRVGMGVYINTWAENATLFFAQYDGANYLMLRLGASGEIKLVYEYADTWRNRESTTTPMGTGQWYFVEFALKLSDNTYKVYVDGNEVVNYSTTIDVWAGSNVRIYIGNNTAGNGADFYIDQVIVSNDSTRNLNALKAKTDYPTSSASPSGSPSGSPSASPSTSPSGSPSGSPSASPSGSPSTSPSASPSASPELDSPSNSPSGSPSTSPSGSPSTSPSGSPSTSPSTSPSGSPSTSPSGSPSTSPSTSPSGSPSTSPSASPSEGTPSASPSTSPSGSPSLSAVDNILDSHYKEAYWLFDVGEESNGDPTYNWSTKAVPSTVYNSTAYSFKVLPESFDGVTLSRPMQENMDIAPSETYFEISNPGNTLDPADFEGEKVIARLVLSDSHQTALVVSYGFIVESCVDLDQRLGFTCVDYLQGYLNGDYPNTIPIASISPAGGDIQDGMCIPVIFGTAYIPIRSQFIPEDSSGSGERYYILGVSPDVITASEVRTPRELSRSIYESGDYTFTYTDKEVNGVTYKTLRPRIAEVEDVFYTGMGVSGGKVLDMFGKLSRTGSVTNPADVIEAVLLDFGIPAAMLDTGVGSSFATAEAVYDGWGLDFNGAFFYKKPRKQVIAELLTMCNSTLRITDKIELHVMAHNNDEYVATHDGSVILKTSSEADADTTFSYNKLEKAVSDSGLVGFQEATEPVDELRQIVVPVDLTTLSPSDETLAVEFVQDTDFVQRIGIMHYQKKYLPVANISYTAKASEIRVQTDDIVKIDGTRYGGTSYALVDRVKINRDLSVEFELTKFSKELDNWGDLAPAVILVEMPDNTTRSWSPVIAGPDGTPSSGTFPNALPGRVIIGAGGIGPGYNAIIMDPGDPSITLNENNVNRLIIGKLGTGNYGLQVNDASGDTVMQVDSTQALIAGWTIDTDELAYESGANYFHLQPSTGIWLGASAFIDAPFSVSVTGALVATSATISGSITATSGTIGGWTINSTKLTNVVTGSGVDLNAAKNRISIWASSEETVVMGFLEGVVRNGAAGTATGGDTDSLIDSSKTWKDDELVGLELYITSGSPDGEHKTIESNDTTTIEVTGAFTASVSGCDYEVRYSTGDYGFWARSGDELSIDGDVIYENGDWIIEHNSSYLVKNASGTTILRLGSDTIQTSGILDTGAGVIFDTAGDGLPDTQGGSSSVGVSTHGLFIYDSNGDQICRFHAGGFRLGASGQNFIEYDVEQGIFLISSTSDNAISIGKGGDLRIFGDNEIYGNPGKLILTEATFNAGMEMYAFYHQSYAETYKYIYMAPQTDGDTVLSIGRSHTSNYYFHEISINSDGYTSLNTYKYIDADHNAYAQAYVYSSDQSSALFQVSLHNKDTDQDWAIDAYMIFAVTNYAYIALQNVSEFYAFPFADPAQTTRLGTSSYPWSTLYVEEAWFHFPTKHCQLSDADTEDATEFGWITAYLEGGGTGYIRIYASK